MPSGVFKITDIPADKVDMVIADYELDAPQSVEKVQQSNGLWTVIATFPGEGDTVEVFGG